MQLPYILLILYSLCFRFFWVMSVPTLLPFITSQTEMFQNSWTCFSLVGEFRNICSNGKLRSAGKRKYALSSLERAYCTQSKENYSSLIIKWGMERGRFTMQLTMFLGGTLQCIFKDLTFYSYSYRWLSKLSEPHKTWIHL